MGKGTSLNRRLFKNYLIDPKTQFRFYLPYLLLIVFFTILIDGLNYYNSLALTDMMASAGPQELMALSQYSQRMISAYIFCLIIMGTVGFVIAAVQSHRILGPMVPILKHLRGLIEGKYDEEVTLRKGDEFHFLAAELNKLTHKLRSEKK